VACSGYKASSRTGHHAKILEKMSEILGDKDVSLYGDKMRKARNTELYDGGMIITKKQAEEYLSFTKKTYKAMQSFLKDSFGTLL